MKKTVKLFGALTAMALLLVVAACGKENNSGADTPANTNTSAPTGTSIPTDTPAPTNTNTPAPTDTPTPEPTSDPSQPLQDPAAAGFDYQFFNNALIKLEGDYDIGLSWSSHENGYDSEFAHFTKLNGGTNLVCSSDVGGARYHYISLIEKTGKAYYSKTAENTDSPVVLATAKGSMLLENYTLSGSYFNNIESFINGALKQINANTNIRTNGVAHCNYDGEGERYFDRYIFSQTSADGLVTLDYQIYVDRANRVITDIILFAQTNDEKAETVDITFGVKGGYNAWSFREITVNNEVASDMSESEKSQLAASWDGEIEKLVDELEKAYLHLILLNNGL